MSARGQYAPRGRRTMPGVTLTDAGPVGHLEWRGLTLPVAVDLDPKREGTLPSIRLCRHGFPMFVLPGGAVVSARELRP